MKLKIKLFPIIMVVTVVMGLLYVVGGMGNPQSGTSSQGKVIRAVVTLDYGVFSPQLTTNSNFTGQRDWVNPGQTYTGTYSQDVLVEPNERVQFWLTAATDIDRGEIAKRKLSCQLYENGKEMRDEADASSSVLARDAPAACMASDRSVALYGHCASPDLDACGGSGRRLLPQRYPAAIL